MMAHGDALEGKWRGNRRMQWVASTLHTTSEHGVSSITTADAHTSAASSRLNWPPPVYLNGLLCFAERRNLVSAPVPSHFNWPLPLSTILDIYRGAFTTAWRTIFWYLCNMSMFELLAVPQRGIPNVQIAWTWERKTADYVIPNRCINWTYLV